MITEKEKRHLIEQEERKINTLEDIGDSLELIASFLDTLLRVMRRRDNE